MPNLSAARFTDFTVNQTWGTDSIIGGDLSILKFDTSNQIISGTFSFRCINQQIKDTMEITEGRFDMHYTY